MAAVVRRIATLALLLASPVLSPAHSFAQEQRAGVARQQLTQAEFDALARSLTTALIALGDHKAVETKARQLYPEIVAEFGADSPQALEFEWLIGAATLAVLPRREVVT